MTPKIDLKEEQRLSHYHKMAMQAMEMDSLLEMQSKMDWLLAEAASRLLKDGCTKEDKNWIKQTRRFGDKILKIIKDEEKLLKSES